MSLTVENGNALPDATSYISLLTADAYHASRGNAAWAGLAEVEREAALIRACDYLAQTYRGRWKGWRTSTEQALDWPRQGVQLTDMAIAYTLDYRAIPNEVQRAQAELALKAATGVLAPDQERAVISESVGAVSVTYDRASPQNTRYTAIDNMLAHLLGGGSLMVPLVRA